MSKRDVILSLLDSSATPDYTPAAFFLHFDSAYHQGQAAVEKHLEFFRRTGMDLVKIQYERTFLKQTEIQTPADWRRLNRYGRDFFEPQLAAVRGLVDALRSEAVVVVTLYSPFMCAGHATSDKLITEHLKQDPEAVGRGLEIATESMLLFARACVDLGVDGFYASTQGGEAFRFDDPGVFEHYIKPYDLAVMNEIDASCDFNILHVCDYHGGYDDVMPQRDYPGHVVSFGLELAGEPISGQRVSELFGGRPYMGGMDRHGMLATGTAQQIAEAANAALRDLPARAILAADCTVPSDTPWDNLKAAIDAAHHFKR